MLTKTCKTLATIFLLFTGSQSFALDGNSMWSSVPVGSTLTAKEDIRIEPNRSAAVISLRNGGDGDQYTYGVVFGVGEILPQGGIVLKGTKFKVTSTANFVKYWNLAGKSISYPGPNKPRSSYYSKTFPQIELQTSEGRVVELLGIVILSASGELDLAYENLKLSKHEDITSDFGTSSFTNKFDLDSSSSTPVIIKSP